MDLTVRASVTFQIGIVGRMVLIKELLQKHGCSPFPPEIEWAKEKWADPAAGVERTEREVVDTAMVKPLCVPS